MDGPNYSNHHACTHAASGKVTQQGIFVLQKFMVTMFKWALRTPREPCRVSTMNSLSHSDYLKPLACLYNSTHSRCPSVSNHRSSSLPLRGKIEVVKRKFSSQTQIHLCLLPSYPLSPPIAITSAIIFSCLSQISTLTLWIPSLPSVYKNIYYLWSVIFPIYSTSSSQLDPSHKPLNIYFFLSHFFFLLFLWLQLSIY